MASDDPDLSRISWGELRAYTRQLEADLLEGGPSDLREWGGERELTAQEIIDEVVETLVDASRFHAEAAERGEAALLAAELVAGLRDRKAGAGVGHLAGLFAGWAIERANRESFTASLAAALAAARGEPAESRLASELRAFVEGYQAGTVTDEELVHRLEQPRST